VVARNSDAQLALLAARLALVITVRPMSGAQHSAHCTGLHEGSYHIDAARGSNQPEPLLVELQ